MSTDPTIEDLATAPIDLLLELLTERDEAEERTESDSALVTELDEELKELRGRLVQVGALVKPSKSQLADKIKAAIKGDPVPEGDDA
jgi:hypothetical protein